ncbi:MAG: oligosaccharide flippase family protein [Sphingomonadaceae bacterium]
MTSHVQRALNIGLRFGTLGVRFLFIFFLARYLDATSVGYYGLFTATVGYCLYFVGLDYYVFVTREILRVPEDQRGRMLKGQAALSGLLYLLLSPAAVMLLAHMDWPGNLVWWFFPILILEHFNQEISRLLVALSEQISASVILFVRQGSWAIAIVALMMHDPDSRHLDAVMALWTCAGVAAAASGIWKVQRLRMGGWRHPIDWNWIRKGITVSAAFLIATLALRGFQTIDRYWLEALGGIEMVGAYVLFLGVASALMVFLDAGVFSFSYPALIRHSHNREYDLARTRLRQMLVQTLVCSLGFAVVSWLLLPWLLDWVGNPVYMEAIHLYPWVMAAMLINALGMVPHYALYSHGQDKPVIYSHIAALPVFALSTWIISKSAPILAVPAGIVIAFLMILTWKTLAWRRISRSYV